jgi:hypothetical protein
VIRAITRDGRTRRRSSQPSPPGLEHARPEVLDDHVAQRHEPPDEILPPRRPEVQRDDLLAAVVDGVPVVDAALAGPEPAQVVALVGQLGLDDLGAELGHQRAAERAGDDLGQLEHADARQWQASVGHGDRPAL